MKATAAAFAAVRVEGALISTAMLDRIADAASSVSGLTAADYHLAPGETIGEAQQRAWQRLQAAWAPFAAAQARWGPQERGTTETRERWLLPLFQEFGYGRLQPSRTPDTTSHHWETVPIHLVGAGATLDRRGTGAKVSPQGVAQAAVNAENGALWGLVSNGALLRLVRANARLARPAFIEFDLEAIFAGEDYAAFRLVWLLAQQSRLEGPPANCWLERWSVAAQDLSVRALEGLRAGVERAIGHLGQGFVRHPANRALRDRLRSGALATQAYYYQLLRFVYRLIFLGVAEDRALLYDPEATATAQERYSAFYSMARLRRIARRAPGTRHGDLYLGLRVVMAALGDDQGCPALGLPALDSLLFAGGERSATPDLDGAALANADLLAAVRALAFTDDRGVRRPVNFAALGAEELGSVYESLLEQHVEVDVATHTFRLATALGNERKTTGSYYTPTSLIDALLDSALNPVLDRAARQPDPAAAILSLKICDPACGSGHFLTRAAHRVASRLAQVRANDGEPTDAEYRHALREVIGHCIYGIDINPMAVELCKVSLWLEALDPGRPLSFLDHHIRCGDSLLGATPALLAAGLPDGAFDRQTGDDGVVTQEFRRRNRQERDAGQQTLGDYRMQPWERVGDLASAPPVYISLDDTTIIQLRRKEGAYDDHRASDLYRHGALLADAWCAAFFWAKTRQWDYPVTTQALRRIARNPYDVAPWMLAEIRRLADHHRCFHWHLAFPEVFRRPAPDSPPDLAPTGWSGGFDVVLSNPPWERVKLQEEEFFAQRAPAIANAPNAAARKTMIADLAQDQPDLYQDFLDARRDAECTSAFLRQSGRFPLTGRGDVNAYSVFAELARSLIAPEGRAGLIVPTGIATDDTNKEFFSDLVRRRALAAVLDCENREGWFPAVDSRMKFALLTMTGPGAAPAAASFLAFAQNAEDLADPARRYALTPADFAQLNPNTLTMPIFRSGRDADLTRRMYAAAPVLVRDGPPEVNPWGVRFMSMFHMSNDSGLFRTRAQLVKEGYALGADGVFRRDGAEDYVPLYEAKMFHQYDHRFATFRGGAGEDKARDSTGAEHEDPAFVVTPRYWVPRAEVERALADWSAPWLLAFRKITRSTDERTFISACIPWVGVGDSAPLLLAADVPQGYLQLLANLNSRPFDFVVRQKCGGMNMSFFIVKQLPVLPPQTYERYINGERLAEWVTRRALELTYTSHAMAPLARDLGYEGPPFAWDEARRAELRGELDGLYAHLYGLARDDVAYILTTFPVLQKNEVRKYGEFRTARLALAAYDALAGEFEA